MIRALKRHVPRLVATVLVAAAVAGCNMITRISEIGEGPRLSRVTNPTAMPNYRPVSMPMPRPETAVVNPNSLWRAGARAFFKDIRAKEVGDILTVSLNLADSAKLENKTDRKRDDSEVTGVTGLFGLEDELSKVFPQGIDPANVVNVSENHDTTGDGQIDRKEDIKLTFAAVVTQILPNGNLAIVGRQEIKVNKELRELMVTGIVRPQDIESDNTISHQKIAEMRVAYGGRGTLSDLQQPRWGMSLLDIIMPF